MAATQTEAIRVEEEALCASPDIPAGMVAVTKTAFFARLYADPRDIMPRITHPEHTTWEVVRDRSAWGWSAPGWRNPGAHPQVFAIVQA